MCVCVCNKTIFLFVLKIQICIGQQVCELSPLLGTFHKNNLTSNTYIQYYFCKWYGTCFNIQYEIVNKLNMEYIMITYTELYTLAKFSHLSQSKIELK